MAVSRRLAAILAADVAGYSRLMGSDEEGTHERLQAHRRLLVEPKIRECHGRIVNRAGDGMLIEFASVIAAVRCAAQIQRAMIDRNAGLPEDRQIKFRIGINVGDVIAEDDDIFGDGVNVAARLEELGEPGGICISHAAREQIRDRLDYAFEELGDRTVKNIARPVRVYALGAAAVAVLPPIPSAPNAVRPPIAPRHHRKAFTAAPTDPFVGRQRELELVRNAFEQTREGRGRIALLAGEPGIGKTRTAQELAAYAAEHDASVLWGRCHEESGAPSYWPWVQVLRASLHDADPEFLAGLGAAAADIADIVPEIRDRLPGLEPSVRLEDPAQARFRLFESIRLFLTGLSRKRPNVLMLDDLHWADTPSLRLLEFLAPEVADAHILLIGTYRATELSRQHPLSNTLGNLARASHFTRISLSGLNVEEVRAFITTEAGISAPEWLAKSLHDQTEGNPLFLREIVRYLDQQGVFRTALSTPSALRASAIRIPEGVKEVIGRRLSLLSPICNDVLATASVIGRDFTAAVLSGAIQPQAEEALFDALDEAVAAHVITETDAGRYQFTHNLVRMTLYDELRTAQRRRLHRAVGNAIEHSAAADLEAVLPDLAHHFREAGDSDRAIDYATRAGRRAELLLAFEDAWRHYGDALDALEQQSSVDQPARCRLLLLLGEAQRKSGDIVPAQSTLVEAANTAEALALPEVQAHAAIAYERVAWRFGYAVDPSPGLLLERALRALPESEVAIRTHVAGALIRALLHSGAIEEAKAQASLAVAMARQLENPAALATNLSYLSDFGWGPDQTEEALEYVDETIAAADRCGNMEAACVAHGLRLTLQLELGNIGIADAELDALMRIDRRRRQPSESAAALGWRAMLMMLRGRLDDAERSILQQMELLRRSITTAASQWDIQAVQIFALRREQGRLTELAPVVAAFVKQHSASETWRPGLALMYLELGRREDARKEFEQLATHAFADLPRDGRWLFCMVFMTEICAALGDSARAEVLYRLLLPYAGRVIVLGGIACCGSADRYLGLLCATMRRWSQAQDHFEQALAMNVAVDGRVPLAHTQHDYAAMLLARDEAGDRERAIAMLKSCLDSAREIGMRALEVRVAKRLEASSEIAREDDLTAREAEVLGLVAIGRSNADIATVLSISLNTVATHVRNILAKTGCANRTEAAAYAMRRGLAPK